MPAISSAQILEHDDDARTEGPRPASLGSSPPERSCCSRRLLAPLDLSVSHPVVGLAREVLITNRRMQRGTVGTLTEFPSLVASDSTQRRHCLDLAPTGAIVNSEFESTRNVEDTILQRLLVNVHAFTNCQLSRFHERL